VGSGFSISHQSGRPGSLGASNFTYAEASWTQAPADWIGAHTRAFAALGGVPKLLVPDPQQFGRATSAAEGVEKRKKVGDRDALIDQVWSAIEALPDREPQAPARERKSDSQLTLRWRETDFEPSVPRQKDLFKHRDRRRSRAGGRRSVGKWRKTAIWHRRR
jgi:hypothetical protein